MYICKVRGRRQVDCGGVVGSPLLMRRRLTGERERHGMKVAYYSSELLLEICIHKPGNYGKLSKVHVRKRGDIGVFSTIKYSLGKN